MNNLTDEHLQIKGVMVYIYSGEGERGNVDYFTGTKTLRAIKQRIKKEIGSGDRWARAEIEIEGYPYIMNEKGEIQ